MSFPSKDPTCEPSSYSNSRKTRRALPVPPAPPIVDPIPEPLKYAVASSPLPEFHYAVSDPAFKSKMGFPAPIFNFRC